MLFLVLLLFITPLFFNNQLPYQSTGFQKRVRVMAVADTKMGNARDNALSLSTVKVKSARVLELIIWNL